VLSTNSGFELLVEVDDPAPVVVVAGGTQAETAAEMSIKVRVTEVRCGVIMEGFRVGDAKCTTTQYYPTGIWVPPARPVFSTSVHSTVVA